MKSIFGSSRIFQILLVLFIFSDCRRVGDVSERQKISTEISTIEDKFFNSNRTNTPQENILVNFVKQENEKMHFVEQTARQIGFPRWNKKIVRYVSSPDGRSFSDSSEIIYIPFVRDSQNYVNAALAITVTPIDTSFRYFCDWEYISLADSTSDATDSAEHYALFFMILDREVFGHRRFVISDTSLFFDGYRKPAFIELADTLNSTGRGNYYSPTGEWCENFTIWWVNCQYQNTPDCSNGCDECSLCVESLSYTLCWPPDGGGSGGNSGGSGGGGGVSGTPPNCQPVALKGANVNPNCEPGWYPDSGGGTNTNPHPLPAYVINNLSKPCLSSALNKLSSGTSNTFFKQIYNIFDSSAVNHLSINEGDLTADTAYGLAYPPVVLPSAGVAFSITMDTVELMSCSEEWMAYVLIHEVAHAAMFGNTIQWDTANSQHNAMAGQFLTLMANSLKTAYPLLSEFDAYAICFAGFFNGVEGNPTPQDIAFSLVIGKKIAQKFGVPYTNTQIAAFGREYTQSGTKGLRGTCN